MRKRILLLMIIGIALSQRIYSQGGLSSSVDIGTMQSSFYYTDTKDITSTQYVVYYKFTITKVMDITITHCGSVLEHTSVSLLDSLGNLIANGYGYYPPNGCSSPYQDYLVRNDLPSGTYYIKSRGAYDNFYGGITTNIEAIDKSEKPGSNFLNSKIDTYPYSDNSSCGCGASTIGFPNTYGGPNGDFYFMFTLQKQADLTLKPSSNTIIHLFDHNRKLIRSNSFFNSNGKIEISPDPNIMESNLAAGDYYIIAERADVDGNVSISISTNKPTSGPYMGTGQNYILTRTMTNESGSTYLDNIQYLDGLGYPFETVQKGFTPNKQNLVTIKEYDNSRRDSVSWLPTPYNGNNDFINFSTLKNEAKTIYADQNPYSKSYYEMSPLEREIQQFNPGADWQNKGKSIKKSYLSNYQSNTQNSNLICSLYEIIGNRDNPQLRKNKNYSDGQLNVTQITDEDGHVSYEFKDKSGQLILTRQIDKGMASPFTTYDIRHDTYYVYDDFGNKCFVLPPLAADGLATDTTYSNSNDIIKKYAYIYHYDKFNRCIWKKLPGAEAVSMVYDKADHLILMQDGEQRKRGEWTFSIPDVFNRIVITGICKGDTAGISNTVVNGTLITGSNGFMNTGYQISNLSLTFSRLLMVNYYDSYIYRDLLDDSVKSKLNYVSQEGYDQKYENTAYPDISAKGLLTGTRVYELSNPEKYTVKAYYYDDKARVVQVRSSNFWGGYDFVYNQYDFVGHALKTSKTHSTNLISNSVTELYRNIYDHAGRLLTTHYQLNDNPEILLAENGYDELGRLATKYRHNSTDSISYKYNVRNWTTNIKNGGFEEKLYYNAPPSNIMNATPCYNGNISYSSWMYNGTTKAYQYDYDNLNRYRGGYSYVNNELQDCYEYSENMSYDKMGNITHLSRWDGYDNIDQLTLTYNGNQLKSVNDQGLPTIEYSDKQYQNKSNTNDEYTYDRNGNMIKDLDREIVTIRYNLLNLPDTIQFKNGNQIINYYAADGSKLRTDYFTLVTPLTEPLSEGEVSKLIYQADVVNQDTRMFTDNFEYTDFRDPETHNIYASLTRIDNSEGYANFGINPKVSYYYYRKDHQGNNREVWRANDKKVVQRTQYYPFGLPWGEYENADAQPYKYNGKEFIEMHGYDAYDYGARHYYPAIGRWETVDPLAEKYYSVSPYAYCANNPIRFIDPNGKEVIAMDENAKRNIRNTLTRDEAKFVKFNKNGTLNTSKLNTSKSMSDNMKALKAEANSDIKYRYAVTDKDHSGRSFSEKNGKMYRGVTEMPGAENNPSPDKDVWVLTSSLASEKLQAKNTAHEGYGHGFMYEKYKNVVKASHTYESKGSIEWDNELKMNTPVSTRVPTNLPLELQIKNVEKEALKNYEDTH